MLRCYLLLKDKTTRTTLLIIIADIFDISLNFCSQKYSIYGNLNKYD